jgi:hypothetical protein
MNARKRKSALLQAPLPPRVKRLGEKFACSRYDRDTFGTPELCTWRVGPRTCRFQTTRPDLARKLSQRSGARLVAWSVNGGYLRVFEETIEPWRAQRLVRRYVTATNGAFFHLKRLLSRRKRLGVSGVAGGVP